jgi:hypothetical protein
MTSFNLKTPINIKYKELIKHNELIKHSEYYFPHIDDLDILVINGEKTTLKLYYEYKLKEYYNKYNIKNIKTINDFNDIFEQLCNEFNNTIQKLEDIDNAFANDNDEELLLLKDMIINKNNKYIKYTDDEIIQLEIKLKKINYVLFNISYLRNEIISILLSHPYDYSMRIKYMEYYNKYTMIYVEYMIYSFLIFELKKNIINGVDIQIFNDKFNEIINKFYDYNNNLSNHCKYIPVDKIFDAYIYNFGNYELSYVYNFYRKKNDIVFE